MLLADIADDSYAIDYLPARATRAPGLALDWRSPARNQEIRIDWKLPIQSRYVTFTENGIECVMILPSDYPTTSVESFYAPAAGITVSSSTLDQDMFFVTSEAFETAAANMNRTMFAEKARSVQKLFEAENAFVAFVDDDVIFVTFPTERPDWVIALDDAGLGHPNSQLLINLIRTLSSLVTERKFHEIDTAFWQLNLKRLSVEVMIALVRTTHTARGKLQNWTAFRDSVAEELAARGLNVREALFGL